MIDLDSLKVVLVKSIGQQKPNGKKYVKNVFVVHAPNHEITEGLLIVDLFHSGVLHEMVGESKVEKLRKGVEFPAVQQTSQGDWMRISVHPKANDPRKAYFKLTPCSAPK
jgi:hypothetical protein